VPEKLIPKIAESPPGSVNVALRESCGGVGDVRSPDTVRVARLMGPLALAENVPETADSNVLFHWNDPLRLTMQGDVPVAPHTEAPVKVIFLRVTRTVSA
jgi:hypothetical protein